MLGGPAFNQAQVSQAWRGIPGVVAIVGGEVENYVADMVHDVIGKRDLQRYPGVFLPDGRVGVAAPPLRGLDELPHPDYDDFPWHLYPHKIVPVLTGRGCGWARCAFCTDILTANGRGYRSREPARVLDEIASQTQRYGTRSLTFLDIKLNANLEMWHALASELPSRVPGTQWICCVHVGPDQPNGLSSAELRAAARAGLTRVTFGLESGSQRMLDAMDKGTRVESNAEFLHHAHEAGISVRCTMIQGYPREEASDLDPTAQFFEKHGHALDRIRPNRFNVLVGSRFAKDYEKRPQDFASLVNLTWNDRQASSQYQHLTTHTNGYRRAMRRVLRAVHAINRRPLKERARQFESVM